MLLCYFAGGGSEATGELFADKKTEGIVIELVGSIIKDEALVAGEVDIVDLEDVANKPLNGLMFGDENTTKTFGDNEVLVKLS